MGEATERGHSSRATEKEQARRALVHAALGCFLDTGYEETSLEQLGARLGVSPRTLQRTFGGKERLALDWQYDTVARVRAGLAARDPGVPVARWWRTHALALAEEREATPLAREQHRLVQTVPSLHARRLDILREAEDLLTDAILVEQPELGQLPARLAALALLGAWESAVDAWVFDARDRSLRDLLSDAIDAAQTVTLLP